jgi:hypothetical protein
VLNHVASSDISRSIEQNVRVTANAIIPGALVR